MIIVGYGRQGESKLKSCYKIGYEAIFIENDLAARKELQEKTENLVINDASQ